ncbi:Ctr copper transporter [Parasponia andersonii]|uniref:Copper transport protein n=1 Tax=Parasponia andersonii TaxID=3476 RepID=A0A2P5A4N7_PARAD|nr:Ctr copper transporter [Parasponia andersonii]
MNQTTTFSWGKHNEILFSGWPGTRTVTYVLALISIFVVSVLVEWHTHRHDSMIITIQSSSNYSRINSCNNVIIDDNYNIIVIGLVETLVHALRVGLAYMVMLGVMSYDVVVLLVAVAGRGLGFLLFGTKAFKNIYI